MVFSPFNWVLRPTASTENAQNILTYLHFGSPILLLIFFLAAFTAHSIATASPDASVRARAPQNQTGPGGKPLPASKKTAKKQDVLDFSPARKLLFNWLSVGTIATFIGNATVVILHALVDREDHWWCGESVAVSQSSSNQGHNKANRILRSMSLLHSSYTLCSSYP